MERVNDSYISVHRDDLAGTVSPYDMYHTGVEDIKTNELNLQWNNLGHGSERNSSV